MDRLLPMLRPLTTTARPGRVRGSAAVLVLGLLAPLAQAAPPTATSAPPRVQDAGDEAYRVLAGLVDKGFHELAVDEGRAFLERYADHPKADLARYRLAHALFELGRHADAAEPYGVLAGRSGFPYRAESAFRLGQCHLEEGALEEARRAFAAVLDLDQDYLHGPATFFLGETAFRAGDHARAAARYEGLLERHAESEYAAGARRGLAWCAWNAARSADDGGAAARTTAERARAYLRNHADEGDAAGTDEMQVLLGEALLEAGQPAEALEAFGAVTGEAFGDARHRGSGFALAALDRPRDAAREFGILLRDHPESRFADEARLQLGLQLLEAGEPANAVRALELAARHGGAEAAYWLAQAELAADDPGGALRTLQRALGANPGDAWRDRMQVARGDALSALGREDDAREAYERAGSDYALYAAAVASLNRADHDDAERLASRLLSEHGDSGYRSQARLVVGEARFGRADYDGAREALEAVLGESPTPEQAAQAMHRLAWAVYLAGDPAGAVRAFERLVAEHADEPVAAEGLHMLARVLLEQGDRESALARGKAYLERYPEGAERAEVLFTCGRAAEGAAGSAYLERLIAEHPASERVPDAHLALAERLSAAGELDGAREHYEAILASPAGAVLAAEARYGLGWCLHSQGEHAAGLRHLAAVGADADAPGDLRRAALELAVWTAARAADPEAAAGSWRAFAELSDEEPRAFEALRTAVSAFRDAGRFGEGQRLLEEFLGRVRDPELTVRTLVEGAYLSLEGGDVARADAQVQVAQKRATDSPAVAEAAFFVGEARYDEDARERAAALYRLAAGADSPVRANALYKLGFVALAEGQHGAAAEAFATLVREHAGHELVGEALFLQGEALYRAERLEEAVEVLERLRREAPGHEVLPKGLFRLGQALGRLERWSACEAALVALAKAAPEFPNLAEAELWRGRALAAQRKARGARQAFARVVSLDGGELAARARIGLGRLQEDEGRVDEALSEYLKVALLYAHDEEVAEALYRAGSCLERMGQAERALEQYREVVRDHADARFAREAAARIAELERS